MLFSIIIPTYNRAHFIQAAISSVLAQSHTDFELIIIDNGSIDSTKETVNAFADPRIQYYFTENNERSAARNYGFDQSNGELICFLDSDEEVTSDYLSCFAQAAKVHTEINVFNSRFEFHGIDGVIDIRAHGKEAHEVIRVWKHLSPVASYCMRRSVCENIKWPEDFWIWEDRHLFLRIALEEEILSLQCVTSIFKDHPERSVHQVDPEKFLRKIEQTPLAMHDLWSTHGETLSKWISKTDRDQWIHESYRGCAIDAIQAKRVDLARVALKKASRYTSAAMFPKLVYTYFKTLITN